MNKQRIIALAIAGVLAISLLASCSSNDADNQDDVLEDETVLTPDMDADVDADMDVDTEEDFFDEDAFNNPNAGMGSPEDDLDMGMGGDLDMPMVDDNGENDSTVVTPPASTTPPVVPEPEPVPDSTTTPSVDAMSKVEAVWTDIEATIELPSFGDIEVDILEAIYGVDSAHLEEFICKIPMINVQATEFFIAKVTSGNMDAVKAAVESRQANLVAQWSDYHPEQLDLVKDYRLVVNGDYIFFGIGYDMDACVDIFNSYTK